MALRASLLCLLASTTMTDAAPERRWDFETVSTDWEAPQGLAEIVAEPGADNQVYRITTNRPHHTRLLLKGSEATPDFVASLRFKVVSFEGARPGVFVYGRLSGGGFRYVSINGANLGGAAYFGQNKPFGPFGSARVAGWRDGGWVWVRIACYGDHLFAKAWTDGAREPRWQIDGAVPGQPTGRFGFGVWTSPREPSRATALFDDVSYRPITAEDLEELGMRIHPRTPLDPALIPTAGGGFESPHLVGLAGPRLAVAIDRRTGELAHLVDRASSVDFVAPAAYLPLFEIELTRPYQGESLTVSAADFERVTVQPLEGGVGLTFDGCEVSPLKVRPRVGIGDDGKIRWRLAITNPSDWAVKAIVFPQFAMPASLGATDHLVLPWGDGAILPRPGEATTNRSAVYPGAAAVQFTARCGDQAGLYLATEDNEGHWKRWRLETRRGRRVEMIVAHLRPELPEAELRLPYEIVLDTFRGDWRDAAEIYRAWALGQPWCRKTLAERDDIPAFLKEGAGVIITGISNPAGRTQRYGERLERLPNEVRAYREKTGLAHVVFVPYGWENRGTWAGINYLPAVPSDDVWLEVNRALRAEGDRTAFLTSGYWWVIKRKKTSNGPAFDDTAQFEARRGMVVHKPDGTPFLVDAYDRPTGGGSWRGLSATLCHGSAEAAATLKEAFLGIARLGVPLISFDQEIGGGQVAPCYDRQHGHPPGYGNWMWTGFRDLCAEILEEGQPFGPELGLFLENLSELAIPYMATYWSRQFAEVDYGATGARGVGLFSYIYHDYVTAIGAACVQGQGARGTRPDALLRCRILANCLTRGLIPGPFLHEIPLETADPWRKLVSAAYFSYWQPYARFPEYLLLGRACRPPAIECGEVETWFYRQSAQGEPLRPRGPRVVKVPLSLPAVTLGSFVGADGSVGTVIVNGSNEPQTAAIALPGRSAVLYQADRTEVQRWDPVAEGQKATVELEPFGTRFLISR